jgi:hypothetical protein
MAFLDFIKNRQQQPGPETSQEQGPRNAREMYAQREAQDQAALKPISPEVKAQADRVMGRLDSGSFHLRTETAQSPSAGGGGNSEPMRQKALNQDHIAFLLSPTTSQVGRVAEAPSQTPSKDSVEQKSPQSPSPSHKRHGRER